MALQVPQATRPIYLSVVAGIVFYFAYVYLTSPSYRPSFPVAEFPPLKSTRYFEVNSTENGPWPNRVFKSSPFKPPVLNITGDGQLADGYLFFTPKDKEIGHGVFQSAPVIMSQDNELVYAYDITNRTNDFRVQIINGKPRITFWQGISQLGHGFGEFVVLDEEYTSKRLEVNASIESSAKMLKKQPPPGLMDFHEHEVTDRGTVLVTAYNHVPFDLSAFGGRKDGWVDDSQFYEIDIATHEVVFRWSALDHFPLSDTRLPIKSYMGNGGPHSPYDPFHINSMQAIGDKYFLISSRHLWSVLLISRKDGHVIWRFDGSEGGDFGPLPADGQFRWQHHVRAHNVTDKSLILTMFDNHNNQDDRTNISSRGLMFRLDLPPDRKVSPVLLRSLSSTEELTSESQGSYQLLPNGNQLLGYGPVPVIREYGPTGDGNDIRWEARFGRDYKAQSYRVFKSEWHGTPAWWLPELFVEIEGSLIKGYVSWNGATDVEAWNVYHENRGRPEAVGRATKQGFETVFEIPNKGQRCFLVGAVQGGKEIRRSNTACLEYT